MIIIIHMIIKQMRIIVTIDVSCSIYSLYDYNDLSVGN